MSPFRGSWFSVQTIFFQYQKGWGVEKSPARKDIVGNLPIELVQKIMGYLSGQDLARCSMVSRRWRLLANSDFLWKNLCKADHPEELRMPAPTISEQNLLDPICNFKRCYTRAKTTLAKWSHNDYWTFTIEDPLEISYVGNGAILVILFEDGHTDIYDLNERRSPKLIQKLPPPMAPSLTNWQMVKLLTSKDRLIIHAKNLENDSKIFFCYAWSGIELKFVNIMYCVKANGKNEFHTTTGNVPPRGHNVDIKLLGVIGECLAVYDMKEMAIYFWSFAHSKCTGRVPKMCASREYIFGKYLYVCNTQQIIAYDTTGEIKLRKEIPALDPYIDDIILHFNKTVLLAELASTGDYRIVLAWDWNLKPMGNSTGFMMVHEVALHPELPIVCYIHQNEEVFQIDELGYEIITRDLTTDTVLLRTPFSLKYGTFSGSGHFSFLHHKYVLYLPGFNTDFYKEQILLNWQTGKVIFHEKSKNFYINFVGSKLIEGNTYCKKRKLFILRIYT